VAVPCPTVASLNQVVGWAAASGFDGVEVLVPSEIVVGTLLVGRHHRKSVVSWLRLRDTIARGKMINELLRLRIRGKRRFCEGE
jgi:hypothetical protein